MTRRLALLTLVTWLACAANAAAQFILVGQDYEECITASASCTFDTGVTAQAGDLVVVLIANRDDADVSSIADGVNSGYTCPDGLDIVVGGATRAMACYYIGSGAGTVTPAVTWSVSSRGYMNFQVWRPTGTVALDATQEGTNTNVTVHVTPALSTGAGAQLVLCSYGFANGYGTLTAGTGYTALTLGDGQRWGGQYDSTSVASGSFTCDMTSGTTTSSAALALSFSDVAGGGPTSGGKRLLILGVGQ